MPTPTDQQIETAVPATGTAYSNLTQQVIKDLRDSPKDSAVASLVSTATTTRTQVDARVAVAPKSVDTLTDGTTNRLFTAADKTKLTGIETGATADQTASEIQTAYDSQVALVTQTEAEDGSSTAVRRWTPERIKQAIVALAPPVTGGGGQGWIDVPEKTSNYTANNFERVPCNTTGGTFTVTASTSAGELMLVDSRGTWGTNKLIFAPGTGLTVEGDTALDCDFSGASVQLLRIGTDWRIIDIVGGSGSGGGGAVTSVFGRTGAVTAQSGDYSYLQITNFNVGADARVAAGIATHEAAGDPHPGYQLESQKNVANGYAGTDSTNRVAFAQLGTGAADGTRFLRDDRTWAVPAGGGGGGGTTAEKLVTADFGAAGNDSSDDSTAFNTAVTSARDVVVPPGRYRLGNAFGSVEPKTGTLRGQGRGCVLVVATGNNPNNRAITAQSTGGTTHTFTGTVTGGMRQVTVNTVVGLAVGDPVKMRLGTDPYDANENHIIYWTSVEAIAGNVVTVKDAVPEDVSGTSHSMLRFASLAEMLNIEDLEFDYVTGITIDPYVVLEDARNVYLKNLFATRAQGPLLEVRESENVIAENLWVDTTVNTHGSAGRVLNIWGSRRVEIRNISAQGYVRSAIMMETQNRGVLLEDVRLSPAPSVTNASLHIVGGSKDVVIRRLHYWAPDILNPLLYLDQDSWLVAEDWYLHTKPKALAFYPNLTWRGKLKYLGVEYPYIHTFERSVALTPSMSAVVFQLPDGIYMNYSLMVTSTTGLTNAYVLNNSGGGANNASALIAAGPNNWVAGPQLGVGNDYSFNDVVGKRLNITTGATMTAGNTLTLRAVILSTDKTLTTNLPVVSGSGGGGAGTTATAASEADVFAASSSTTFVSPAELKPRQDILLPVTGGEEVTVGARYVRRLPYAFRLSDVRASVSQAPTGSTIIVDVKLNNTSIFSTLLSIDPLERTSTTAASQRVLTTTALPDDGEIVAEVTQKGSEIPGRELKVALIGNRD